MICVLIVDLNDNEHTLETQEWNEVVSFVKMYKEKISKQHKKWNAANKEKIKQKLQEKLIKELKEYYLKGANK